MQYTDEPLKLFFPLTTDPEVIEAFLKAIYPDLYFRIWESNKSLYFVPDETWEQLDNGTILLTPGFVGLGNGFKIGFEDSEEDPTEKYIIINSFQNASEYEDEDPCFRITQQFNADYIFDVLEFIDKSMHEEYFKALLNIINEDSRTAASQLALVSESFMKNVIRNNIPNSLKGLTGIVKIRNDVKSKTKVFDLINSIKKIQDTIDMSEKKKEILDTMTTGFHLLRKLRNKAQHPDPPFNILQTETMLYLLIYLQDEVRVFCKNC